MFKHIRQLFPGAFFIFCFSACTTYSGNTKYLQNLNSCDYNKFKNSEEAAFQTDITFPLENSNRDISVLPDKFISFTAFKGQGYIYITSKNIKRFSLYINGKKIKTSGICKTESSKIYIGDYVLNGKNLLLITNIQFKNLTHQTDSHWLNIQIPYPVILKTKTRNENINQKTFKVVDDLMQAQIENGFPAAQIVVIKNGKMIKNSYYGYISNVDQFGKKLNRNAKKKIDNNTLFDLASNTKIYAVNFALQKLVSEGKVSLQDKVSDFFPDFKDGKKSRITGKNTITVSDLLKHQSGFPACGKYYNNKSIAKKDKNDTRTNKEITLNLICSTPLIYSPGTESLYSDINYMLLGFIIEKITEMPLDKYVEENIYLPLGLNRICYKPMQHGFTQNEIAATEINGRKRLEETDYDKRRKTEKYLPIHGTVHDEDAYTSMEQVSGHAGLFANAESAAVLAQVMINGGGYGKVKLFDSEVLNLFTSQSELFSSAGLGWKRQGSNNGYSWAFSPLASGDTIGHTGWTGTLTLIDLKENIVVIIFTNAKNTPALTGKYQRGKFEGDYYLVKNYGAITTLIYSALKNYNNKIIYNMLIELAIERNKLAQIYNNEGFYKDLNAIMKTIQKHSHTSPELNYFFHSKKSKEILNNLKEKARFFNNQL